MRRVNLVSFICVVLLVCGVECDVYMHSPRGCNDRLNENGDRQNANRLFDSENNARGGYCWGPPMSFVEGSFLPIEWTAQHGCGGTHVTCNEIIQYMCSDTTGPESNIIRDGTETTTIPDDINNYNAKNDDGSFRYGMNENYTYYQDCKGRERNKGLFVADQTPGGRATNTRQNPGNNRYGFECTEERDYYPYWHPSPWKDIVVLTDNLDHCDYYQAESQNVKAKNFCTNPKAGTTVMPNNEKACLLVNGTWSSQPPHGIPPPDCKFADFSRDNHLGNTAGSAETANYTWTVPTSKIESCITSKSCNCAIRIRYNITTNESKGLRDEFMDSRQNGLLKNNPTVLAEGVELTLALNTAQFGRTFQDRSFMFHILPRPNGISDTTKIFNLNVRGKRGNIVQVYPATEYDFVPGRLEVQQDDIVHFQWTGCDTNPGNNQGEGRASTDRSNIIQIKSLDSNIPVVATNDSVDQALFESDLLRTRMALIDQTGCVPVATLLAQNNNNANTVNQLETNCAKLNAAKTPYFNGGLIRMNKTGDYYYMNSRNNNFSNRTQKGKLTVTERKSKMSAGVIAGAVLGSLAAVAVAAGGAIYYGKKHPHTALGRAVDRLPHIPVERYFSSRSATSAAAPTTSPRRQALLND